MAKKHWLRLRGYLHFSKRFDSTEKKNTYSFIKKYVSNKDSVQKHRFAPLIHYKIIENHFRRPYDDSVKSENRIYTQKSRPIFYCNHLDAQIFAYYTHKLSLLLEKEYKKSQVLNNSVIGYRAIPLNINRNKSTIDFANEVFSFIKSSNEKSLVVACLDISSFYDNLDHKILKRAWYNLKDGKKALEDDEFKVFKAITQAHYIDLEDILSKVSSFDKRNKSYLHKSKRDKLISDFSEIRKLIEENHHLVKKYDRYDLKVGIPQGTPISAVLSNLYFLNADKEISQLFDNSYGLYRRYSDDILIICRETEFAGLYKNVLDIIKTLKLEISANKNQVGYFRRIHSNADWVLEFYQNNILLNKPINYLGFSFDSKNIRIKNGSLSKYYRGVKRLIRRSASFAKKRMERNIVDGENKDEWMYKRKIYKSKSYLGAKRKEINGKVSWGNYISYARNAAKIMNEKGILNQIKNHWKIINNKIIQYEKAYKLPKQQKK